MWRSKPRLFVAAFAALVLLSIGFLWVYRMAREDSSSNFSNQEMLPVPEDGLQPKFVEGVVNPAAVADLRRLQEGTLRAVKDVQPAVVAVRHTGRTSNASGVIITPGGLVLSQWHVSHAIRDRPAPPGESHPSGSKTSVILADGRECEAKLLGANRGLDISLLQLTGPGPFPYCPLDAAVGVRPGDWVMKFGYPGGYSPPRPSSVRLGRVLCATSDLFATDCLINGGDSGGPFFDLSGRLVGVVWNTTADLSSVLQQAGPEVLARHGSYLFGATPNAVIAEHLDSLKRGEVDTTGAAGAGIDVRLSRASRLDQEDWSGGAHIRAAFAPTVDVARESVVTVLNRSVVVALATVVELSEGVAWALTKASEVPETPFCQLPDGSEVAAQVVGVDPATDLALLRFEATGLRPISWAPGPAPEVGTLLAAVGVGAEPFAVGVVSVPLERSRAGSTTATFPARVPAIPLSMYAHFDPDGVCVVDAVWGRLGFPDGLRAGDRVLAIDGRRPGPGEDLGELVRERFSGDIVEIEISRDGVESVLRTALLPQHDNVGFSYRANEFPASFELAAPICPYECGGPVVNLEGQAVGIVIARFAPQGCRVIPGDHVRPLIIDLKSGKFAVQ